MGDSNAGKATPDYSRLEVYALVFGFDTRAGLPNMVVQVCQPRFWAAKFYHSDKGQQIHRSDSLKFSPNMLRGGLG
ncbi:hypothetical protein J4212_07325 [Candidatus Woesearchaeota archaeon]|nr:hypothetical protein [Candidatus Woesearchaeota archaeon]